MPVTCPKCGKTVRVYGLPDEPFDKQMHDNGWKYHPVEGWFCSDRCCPKPKEDKQFPWILAWLGDHAPSHLCCSACNTTQTIVGHEYEAIESVIRRMREFRKTHSKCGSGKKRK